jgi:hypothetical protein
MDARIKRWQASCMDEMLALLPIGFLPKGPWRLGTSGDIEIGCQECHDPAKSFPPVGSYGYRVSDDVAVTPIQHFDDPLNRGVIGFGAKRTPVLELVCPAFAFHEGDYGLPQRRSTLAITHIGHAGISRNDRGPLR